MSKFQITRGFVFRVPGSQKTTASLRAPAAPLEDGPGPQWAPSSASPEAYGSAAWGQGWWPPGLGPPRPPCPCLGFLFIYGCGVRLIGDALSLGDHTR